MSRARRAGAGSPAACAGTTSAAGRRRTDSRTGTGRRDRSDRARRRGACYKGQKMAGHMGAVQVTAKNLRVIAKDEGKGLLLIEGAVPGATNGTVRVRRAKKQDKKIAETYETARSIDVSRARKSRRSTSMTRYSASSRTSPSCTRRSWRRWRTSASGTATTKTRGEVHGLDPKDPARRRAAARSRQGSIGAPQHRHGGIVFGPRPRSYAKDLPKKMRRLAIRSLLSAKAADGCLRVVNDLGVTTPSTKAMAERAQGAGFRAIRAGGDRRPRTTAVKASVSNLQKVTQLPAGVPERRRHAGRRRGC